MEKVLLIANYKPGTGGISGQVEKLHQCLLGEHVGNDIFSGEWRGHVLPIAFLCGYMVVLAFSNFAQSERFHLPALPLELMFAAYAITHLKAKHIGWYNLWLCALFVIDIAWSWFKIAGRQ